ncbi:MAG: KpsF/GutQ family sugar-phosphate isomerase [Kiritimatiellia bacterium]|nr:KpsF/GutQ family sugar-phosphate isomerase [Kiritimatiellia bacterium]
MSYTEYAKEVLDIEIEQLRKVRDSLDGDFDRAVDLILQQLALGGKIVLTGVGKNLPIAQKIAATLTSTGCPSVVLHPSEAMHGDLGLLLPNDIVLALSYSGASEELLPLLPAIKRCGVRLISFTSDPDSPLGRAGDAIIPIRVDREACPFNIAPTASTTAELAVGDALAMVLLRARGFRREDFAKLHPGGAIGRTLLLRVADLMRTGERMARVRESATVRDAVLEMTRARAGAVAVVDEFQVVQGIFTDGDLRRNLDDPRPLADRPIAEVMTRNPIHVRDQALAVEVLRLFEEHNIDDLIVLDAEGRLAGLVDLQDLPKMKIF